MYRKVYSEYILRNEALETGFSTMILLFLILFYLTINCIAIISLPPHSLGSTI
jgi:hypothetical protein